MVLTVVKVAKKIDAIITRIGLNPAITGDSLGRSFPGVLTYTVARTVASRVVQTAGKNTAAGKTSVQTQTKSGSKPGSKPTSSGRYYGGVNTVNTFADSRRSEQQSGNSPRQAEPRASGTEPAAQPASAAADRSFVMPGTRRPVNHVPSEHKIAPSDTAGKAGHTVSRSSHVQAGGQQHTASAAQQHILLYKRLSNGRFQWPRSEAELRLLDPQSFRWLMEGLRIEQKTAIRKGKPRDLF